MEQTSPGDLLEIRTGPSRIYLYCRAAYTQTRSRAKLSGSCGTMDCNTAEVGRRQCRAIGSGLQIWGFSDIQQ